MENLEALLHGFAIAASFYHIALMLVGVLLGILVGVLPGLGAPNGVSLLLPLTFGMQPVSAIILLSSMYWGALFGGSVTSILFNIPGEPSSVATTFDGYPWRGTGALRPRLPPLSDRQPSARWWASFSSPCSPPGLRR
jgi:putative tricarboxylic transport membrane protein